MTITPVVVVANDNDNDQSRSASNRMRNTHCLQFLQAFSVVVLPFLWMVVLVLTFSTLPIVHAKKLHLTFDNYNELTKSKTVFLKFYAPWYETLTMRKYLYPPKK
jgi:hypothetical protein